MTQYYLYSDIEVRKNAPLLDPGVSIFLDVWTVSSTLSLTNRTGLAVSPNPFPLTPYPRSKPPTDLTNFNLTYEQCCDLRASQLIQLSRKTNLPLSILYSGGIDSTLVLISFLKQLSKEEARERLHVIMNFESISENPLMYEKYIRDYCTVFSAAKILNMFDKKSIIVTGECNDQLMGSMSANKLEKAQPGASSLLFQPYTFKTFSEIFRILHVTKRDSIQMWFEFLDYAAKNALCEVKTGYELFWWFNFAFKWQDVFFRLLLSAGAHTIIDEDLLENYYFHFYEADYFQKWSLLNPHLKVKDSWDTYKFHAKEIIFNFDHNEEYFKTKRKIPSLTKAVLQRKRTPVAIDTTYIRHDTVDYLGIYDRNHFFYI